MSFEPLLRAKKVVCKEHITALRNSNIAAIDFGTTCCTVTYKTSCSDSIEYFPFDRIYPRVPNAIMLSKSNDGGIIKVESYGLSAQKEYNTKGARGNIYLERMKMLLERDESISRESIVQAVTGEKLYIVEVIAVILKYLKEELVKHLANEPFAPSPEDFIWVITIPAMWKPRGKRLMREAAYMACLLKNSRGITQFTPVGQPVSRPSEENAENLFLALEPDAAAIHAQGFAKNALQVLNRNCPTTYLLCDTGGGTVDVTIHNELSENKIEIINTPLGRGCAGTSINEEFSKLLQEIVDDEKFETFRADNEKAERRLNRVLYAEFEDEKVKFGKMMDKKLYYVNIPYEMTNYYTEHKIEEGVKKIDGVSFDSSEGVLEIESCIMERFFKKSIDSVIACVEKAITECNKEISHIYLVGGLGSSEYVKEKVKKALQQFKMEIVIPETPILSVAKGAVIWGLNPNIVTSRKVDATYGISVCPVFDSSAHDSYYKRFDDEDRIYRCNGVFCCFLKKGEEARQNECFTIEVIPSNSSDTEMQIDIFCTSNDGVLYTTDKQDTKVVESIGRICLDIPNPDGLPRKERLVDISMDFSGTEISASAKYRVTGKKVKTVCDFLTATAVV